VFEEHGAVRDHGSILYAAGMVSPLPRGARETAYQFDRPYILDSSDFETTFGVAATRWTMPSTPQSPGGGQVAVELCDSGGTSQRLTDRGAE
jgi:hypothetical protein